MWAREHRKASMGVVSPKKGKSPRLFTSSGFQSLCFLNIYETNLHFGFLRTRSSASVSILRGVPTKANVPPRKIPTALSLELCLPDFSLPLLLILAAFVWKVLPISCLILLSEDLEGRATLLPKSALSLEESKCYPNAAT